MPLVAAVLLLGRRQIRWRLLLPLLLGLLSYLALREGLDMPEVSLVAILDADKEGFLRSETSLVQTIGRAARHVNAKAILYADKVTKSMQRAIEETERRRATQQEHNQQHGITPETIRKNVSAGIESVAAAQEEANAAVGRTDETEYITQEYINEIEVEMMEAAEALEFERAASLRDRITELRDAVGQKISEAGTPVKETGRSRRRRRVPKEGKRVPRPRKRS